MTKNGSEQGQSVCPMCGASGGWLLPFLDRDSKAIICRAEGYHWRVCVVCGSGYPSSITRLAELQRYWDVNRIEDLPGEEAPVWAHRLQSSHYWAEQTWQFLSPHLGRERGRFLDIACGLGATVRKLQDQGWQATGIDADPNTRQIHHQLGIETVIGQFEGVETLGRFDLISIAHAIYFISDPKQFLRRVRESLEDRGLFLALISNLTSALGDGYPSQVTTWYPTAESLSNALVLEGFEVVATRKLKGSIFVLARASGTAGATKSSAWASALGLRTQAWRHRLYGRQILWLGRFAKRLLRIGGRR